MSEQTNSDDKTEQRETVDVGGYAIGILSLCFVSAFAVWTVIDARWDARKKDSTDYPIERTRKVSGVAHVVDNATIAIGEQQIRIAGIETCYGGERQAVKDGKAWPCDAETKAFLTQIADGKKLNCEAFHLYSNTTAGQCFTDDKLDIGLAMITNGFAAAISGYLPDDYPLNISDYLDAQDSAREQKLGIWGAQIATVGN